MGQYYTKINTAYFRDMEKTSPTYNCILPDKGFCQPEFELLKDLKWECTEKIDGTNCSIHIIPVYDHIEIEYHGKTENAQIPPHLLKKMQEMFPEDKLVEYFTRDGKEITTPIVLFGEGYGVKIQNGGNYIKDDCSFILFDVKVGDWWLKREDCEEIAKGLGIDIVPLIGHMTLKEAEDYVRKGFKSIIAQNKDYDAEGLVCKAPMGLMTRGGQRIVTKIKTCDFRDLQRKALDYYNKLYKI